ncbi:MAG: carboxypeptidase regulatory-like domain-containing protein [Tunicatimonas sp.]
MLRTTTSFLSKYSLIGCLLGICCSGLTLQSAWAQSTNASIKGTISDADGEALPGATVRLRNESTGFSVGTATNLRGEYLIQQLPLGGPYQVTASFVGYGEIIKEGYTLNQGDQVIINFFLREATSELEEVVVTDQSLRSRIQREGNATAINDRQIKQMPNEGRNFTQLTSLSPLQGGGSINLGGQRRTSTNITLDGVNARNQLTAGEIGRGPYTVSLEAIREFEVATNIYDVTQGRQAGGAINAVTKSGTNKLEGTAFVYHRNDALASQFDIRGGEREQDFYNYQWGFSLGGPLIKDKLHFFVAFDRQDEGEPVFIADIREGEGQEEDEGLYRIRLDTLRRFVQIARDEYGVSDDPQFGEFSRKTVANTIFTRLDWQINDRNTLTLRNNFSDWNRPFSVFDNSNIDLAETVGDFSSQENSLLLSLRSNVSSSLTNELKVQYQRAERAFVPNSQLPSANIPRAIVQVTSPFPTDDNPNATNTVDVQIGGQRYTPETNLEQQVQLVNTAYWQTGRFNVTFGTDNMVTYLETLLSNEQNGRFFFNSLQDFADRNPSRYAREVPLQGLPIVKQTVLDLSLFGQIEADVTPNLNLMFGLRYDLTAFLNGADYNPVLDQTLGIRTDRKPSDWNNVQPRFQGTWNVRGNERDFVKFGAGIFSAQPHYYAQVNNIQNSGVLLGAVDVSENVPTPDFVAYRNDPSTVPGVLPGVTPFSTINAVSEDFEVPSTLKANLSYTRLFSDRLSLTINGLVSRTWNNYVYQERNLVDEPFFRIAQEANRGVFVPAETINEKGQNDWLDSRKTEQAGRVLELTPEGILDQMAVVVEANYLIGEDGYVSVSYTRNQAKDNSSYNCCVANTSTFLPVKDDPRALYYGFSDNHFGSKLAVNFASPSILGFSLGATLIGSGGTRYSLHAVGGGSSLNGDFNLRNDLAYVFDPNDPATPEGLREGLQSVLNDPDVTDGFKDYVRNNFGEIAERNGGINPFVATLDLRLIKRIALFGNHALELSADMFNFTNLLNKDWGVDRTFGRTRNFLNINGFDQASQQYSYRVNAGAGREPISGTPWRAQLGVRYEF